MNLKRMQLKVRFKMFKSLKVKIDKNTQAFFALLRAGLWENILVHDSWFMVHGSEQVDWEKVYQLAEDQSVVGLVLAGLEHSSVKPPQNLLLQWIGEVQIIEQQNKAMNEFVASLIEKLRENAVYAILVKGQGIAQCHEKPLWRSSGDVDLLLSDQDYEIAKSVLLPQAIDIENEYKSIKHLGMTMPGDFVVELHGTLHSRLSTRIDKGIDESQRDVFYNGSVRSWLNDNTQVLLPSPDNDVIFIFTHILHHFYIEGIGLRQICDWCRLLWTYRDSLNPRLLESRIRKMGLTTEWKAFAAFAIEFLGMPVGAMPLFSEDDSRNHNLRGKAEHILKFILVSGNLGHNLQIASSKVGSVWNKMKVFIRHAIIFPIDSIRFFFHFLWNGVELAINK